MAPPAVTNLPVRTSPSTGIGSFAGNIASAAVGGATGPTNNRTDYLDRNSNDVNSTSHPSDPLRAPNNTLTSNTSGLESLPNFGENSIVYKHTGKAGQGVALEYSPKRIGQLLVNGSKEDGGKSLISNLRSAAATIASTSLAVPIYSVDDNGNISDTSVKEGGALRPGGTYALMARTTTGFNVISRAGEALTSWLTLAGTDPTTAAGGSSFQGVSEELENDVKQVFASNPEIPAALAQLAEALKLINTAQTDKKAEGDALASAVGMGTFQKLQPNTSGNGGGQQR